MKNLLLERIIVPEIETSTKKEEKIENMEIYI